MLKDDDRIEIHLVLRPLPSPVPWGCRLRRLLKAALRAYGFRNCGGPLDVRPVADKPAKATKPSGGTAKPAKDAGQAKEPAKPPATERQPSLFPDGDGGPYAAGL